MESSIKLADLIGRYFQQRGLKHVFAVAGGASLHLIHGFKNTKRISVICCHHEQSCAMAADAYTRLNHESCVAIATSGPGATNLITGIAGCYYDSIPTIFLTGQVSTFRSSSGTKLRQMGFQETPIVKMVEPIVKYAVQITEANNIVYEIEKARIIANNGRPGPVLIDIPDNLQRALVKVSELKKFIPEDNKKNQGDIAELRTMLMKLSAAKRPVLIAGWGVHISKTERLVREFIESINIPVALTWGACDLLEGDHPLRIGTFGTHGLRYANFAVQNADFILSLGCKLDTKATGSPSNSFAREAWKCVVDVDIEELLKQPRNGLKIDLAICAELSDFMKLLINELDSLKIERKDSDWVGVINGWKSRYEIRKEAASQKIDGINPYIVMHKLGNVCNKDWNIFLDTGCTVAWAMQSFNNLTGARVYHDFNNTAMGWALPAAIGGSLADQSRRTLCITGEGSLMMNIQELATIKRHDLDIVIIIVNNNGYSMIKQTQDQWLNSEYIASSTEGGIGFPDFGILAKSFEIESVLIESESELNHIEEIISNKRKSALVIDIKISSNWRVSPQVKYGKPNEDPEPLLNREELEKEMLIDIYDQKE